MPRSTVAACCLLVATVAHADSWPWYGGPNHNGIITEAQAVPDGKNMSVLWKVRMLGTGHSGPAVVGDEVFMLDRRGQKRSPSARGRHISAGSPSARGPSTLTSTGFSLPEIHNTWPASEWPTGETGDALPTE
jgi:hypothetical protein